MKKKPLIKDLGTQKLHFGTHKFNQDINYKLFDFIFKGFLISIVLLSVIVIIKKINNDI